MSSPSILSTILLLSPAPSTAGCIQLVLKHDSEDSGSTNVNLPTHNQPTTSSSFRFIVPMNRHQKPVLEQSRFKLRIPPTGPVSRRYTHRFKKIREELDLIAHQFFTLDWACSSNQTKALVFSTRFTWRSLSWSTISFKPHTAWSEALEICVFIPLIRVGVSSLPEFVYGHDINQHRYIFTLYLSRIVLLKFRAAQSGIVDTACSVSEQRSTFLYWREHNSLRMLALMAIYRSLFIHSRSCSGPAFVLCTLLFYLLHSLSLIYLILSPYIVIPLFFLGRMTRLWSSRCSKPFFFEVALSFNSLLYIFLLPISVTSKLNCYRQYDLCIHTDLLLGGRIWSRRARYG